MTNQPNVGEVLKHLVEKCSMCEGGDCLNCGQKPINIEIALTKLTEIIEGCIPNNTFAYSQETNKYIKIIKENFVQAGFPLNNKGGNNGK